MCKFLKTVAIVLCSVTAVMLLSARVVYAADATPSQATDNSAQKIYKTVGPNGEVIYSDKPSPGSEQITVPVGGGYKPVPPPAGFTPYQAPSQAPAQKPIENSITITSPANEESIWSGPGELKVSVSLGSGLGPGQTLEYQIDGKTVYSGTETSRTFDNIFRGTHVVTVRIKDATGESIESQPVTVYMKRPFVKKN